MPRTFIEGGIEHSKLPTFRHCIGLSNFSMQAEYQEDFGRNEKVSTSYFHSLKLF
jgi:hypothetical protein